MITLQQIKKRKKLQGSNEVFKIVYSVTRKKWAVQEILEDLIKFISQEIENGDIQNHVNESEKNATYQSHFSVEEYLEIINDLIEKELKDNLLAGTDFSLL